MDSVTVTIIVIFLVIAIPVFLLTKINKEKMDEIKERRKNTNRKKRKKK